MRRPRRGEPAAPHAGPRARTQDPASDPGLRRLGKAAPAAGAQPAKRRVLEDPDAGALGESLPQAERQARRLNSRRTRVEHAATESRRPAPPRHLIRTQLTGLVALAELATGLERLVRDMVLGGRRGDLQVAALPVPGVNVLLRAEPADLVNGILRGSQNSRRACSPDPIAKGVRAEPQRVGEAAVPAAWPVPAAIGVEQDHARLRLELGDLPGGPHAGVPGADHEHVAVQFPGREREPVPVARLLEPVSVRGVLHELRMGPTARRGTSPRP